MVIELGSPAVLPFGGVRFEVDDQVKTGLIGLTVQHPPIQLFARPDQALTVSGPRADIGRAAAEQFLHYHQLPALANLEIELAIPAFVGLGSEAILAMSVARALAQLHELPFDEPTALAQAVGLTAENALEVAGFAQGGLLLAEVNASSTTAPFIRRQEITHDNREAWAFVFVLPRVSPDIIPSLESDRRRQTLAVVTDLSNDNTISAEQFFHAVEADDIAAFGQAIMAIQQSNQAALTTAGQSLPFHEAEQAILDLMRDNGALAWGRSATGLSLFGLVKGAQASIDLRKVLMRRLGPFGGRIMATITDNRGAQCAMKDHTFVY
jgi:predicted sugar kinase